MFVTSKCQILRSRFAAQQASLLYMRLGQELEKPVHGEGDLGFLRVTNPRCQELLILEQV